MTVLARLPNNDATKHYVIFYIENYCLQPNTIENSCHANHNNTQLQRQTYEKKDAPNVSSLNFGGILRRFERSYQAAHHTRHCPVDQLGEY